MISFRATEKMDSDRITEWIRRDLDHAGQMSADWWSEGTVLSSCVEDGKGPVLYIRLDSEGLGLRLNIQFAPEDLVTKSRTAKTILKGMPVLAEEMKKRGAKAIVFESTANPLIKFMNRMGFEYWKDNDYVLSLSEE
jgi:hypothetical protein